MGIYGKNLEMGKILRDGKIWLFKIILDQKVKIKSLSLYIYIL